MEFAQQHFLCFPLFFLAILYFIECHQSRKYCTTWSQHSLSLVCYTYVHTLRAPSGKMVKISYKNDTICIWYTREHLSLEHWFNSCIQSIDRDRNYMLEGREKENVMKLSFHVIFQSREHPSSSPLNQEMLQVKEKQTLKGASRS